MIEHFKKLVDFSDFRFCFFWALTDWLAVRYRMDLTGIVVLITISSGNPETRSHHLPYLPSTNGAFSYRVELVESAQSDIFGRSDRPKHLEWNSSRLAEGTLPALCGA